MNIPESILIGYFPKKIALRPDWIKNSVVEDIYSVSECISKGPDNWIDMWKHNITWWLFDTPKQALRFLALTMLALLCSLISCFQYNLTAAN